MYQILIYVKVRGVIYMWSVFTECSLIIFLLLCPSLKPWPWIIVNVVGEGVQLPRIKVGAPSSSVCLCVCFLSLSVVGPGLAPKFHKYPFP